ncbi:MAG: tetratricopeptide repeat protein [Planctomycetota bacterium]
MARCKAVGAFAAAALLVPGLARADILVLRDGRLFDGVDLERTADGFVVHYENGDVAVPAARVLDALIEDQPTWTPATDEEREKAEKGLVPFEGRWISPPRRAELIQERIAEKRRQIEDIQAHREWRNRHEKKTSHFEFEYTVPEHLFSPLGDRMEAYFTAFAKDWKVRQPRELGRLKVCFYNDRKSFERTSGAGSGVLGYFRFVEPLELNFFFDRLDRPLTEEVMYHETNHYLQKLIDPSFSMPHFPGESLAEYYGASDYDPETKKFSTGLILDGRLTEVKRDVMAGDMMGLAKLVSTDGMYEHYNWGWTLVHFLMNHAKYGKKFQKFVLDLPSAKDVRRELIGLGNLRSVSSEEIWRVFQDRLGLQSAEDVVALEKEWHTYVEEKLDFVTARGLEEAAVSASRAGMPIKAKRLFEEAIEAGTENPMTYHRFGKLLEADGDHARAVEMWEKAIAIDSMEAEFHLSLGRAQVLHGDREEGRRRVRLAIEIDEEVASWDFDPELLGEDEDDGGGDGDGGEDG